MNKYMVYPVECPFCFSRTTVGIENTTCGTCRAWIWTYCSECRNSAMPCYAHIYAPREVVKREVGW